MKHGEYDLERHELTARSFEIEKSEGRNLTAIVTIRDDSKYPQPQQYSKSGGGGTPSSTPAAPPPPTLPGAKSHDNDEDIFTRRTSDQEVESENCFAYSKTPCGYKMTFLKKSD